MNGGSSKNQAFSPLKESLKSARDSFENFSEEVICKWRIGRRNFP
jgi:hypothetical protein